MANWQIILVPDVIKEIFGLTFALNGNLYDC
jgi:hypothetical protein